MVSILGQHISLIRPGTYYRHYVPKRRIKYRCKNRKIKLTAERKKEISHELGYRFIETAE